MGVVSAPTRLRSRAFLWLRAFGGTIFVVVLYVLSLIPNTRFRIGEQEYSFPFARWTYQALTYFAPPPVLSEMATWRIAALLPEFLLSLLFSLILLSLAKRVNSRPIPFGDSGGAAVLWIILIVVASWITNAVVQSWDYYRGLIELRDVFRPSCGGWVAVMRNTQSLIIFVLVLCLPVLIAPFFEEVMFRGFLYDACVPAWGLVATATVTSALFSLAHWRLGLDVPVFANFFIFGVLVFAARVRFHGIGVPIAAHIVVNASYSFDGLLRC